ncbi:MAG TPA: DUF3011 domain-containing protein [Pseudobdellovibrionaceae bacterium]
MTLFRLIPAACLLALSMVSAGQAQVGRIDPGGRVVITCSSSGYAYNTCYVGQQVAYARLVSQLSRSACIEGSTWGYANDSIWVDKGCRANFEVITADYGRPPGGGGYPPPGRGGYPPPGRGGYPPPHHPPIYEESINCASSGYRFNSCYPASGLRIRSAQLSRQDSRTQCVEGNTWGYDNNRIWVDKGCRGEFRVQTY